MCVWAVWREDEKDFGIRLCEVKLEIVWDGGVVVENLSEEYWFLDSFGADLVLETRTAVEMPILGRFSFI